MEEAQYIEIPGWEQFQHYRDRDPIWIKNYVRLLGHDDYLSLSGHRRAVLHGIWLAYASSTRRLRGDALTISRRLSLRVTKADLDSLVHAGFIHIPASKTLAQKRKPASKVLPQRNIEKRHIEQSENGSEAKASSPSRKRDELWDAFTEILRTEPSTSSERGRWNKGISEIRNAGGTADDVKRRAREYQKRWPDVSVTVTALAANWGSLKPKAASTPTCPECGVNQGRHAEDCSVVRGITQGELSTLAANMREHR